MSEPTNFTPFRRQARLSGAGGGNGDDVEIRLARLEERFDALKENVATKLDVEGFKNWMLRWFVVTSLSAAIVALVVRALWPE